MAHSPLAPGSDLTSAHGWVDPNSMSPPSARALARALPYPLLMKRSYDNSRVECALTPEAAGTRIHADYGGDVADGLRLVALLQTFVLARILLRDVTGLRRVLEAEDRAHTPGA
ncbi:hypothetical protein [Cellulomonas sp.]|uniref:hypothetical protein n=1 Tax=Cellulomonas sp. TaxID=40001 RepID=UPI003BAA7145